MYSMEVGPNGRIYVSDHKASTDWPRLSGNDPEGDRPHDATDPRTASTARVLAFVLIASSFAAAGVHPAPAGAGLSAEAREGRAQTGRRGSPSPPRA